MVLGDAQTAGPPAVAVPIAANSQHQEHTPITTLHILLVDSLLPSQESISKLLRSSGNTVTCCSSSKEAFVLLQRAADAGSQPYSLILKEHTPNANADACRFLRRMKLRFLSVPVVGEFAARKFVRSYHTRNCLCHEHPETSPNLKQKGSRSPGRVDIPIFP